MFRAIILYLLIILSLRLMGKRQLGELQPSELVTTILISNIASIPIENPNLPLILSVVPILTLVVFEFLVSSTALKSRRFRRILSGKPTVLIKEGTINQRAMKKLRFTIDDLLESLRTGGVFDISTVHCAIVETTGKVSVLVKESEQAVTPKILSLDCNAPPLPYVVISDGKTVPENLKECNLDRKWLLGTLKENGCIAADVFLMTADCQKNYLLVKKERKDQICFGKSPSQ